jgi:NAD(P)-dependent dehydrogenase (short-subunit alcohol dehydrogenase family)
MTKNVIVVTGANNGIGFYMTKTLLEDGYCLATIDISDENLAPLKSVFSERLLVFNCDVTNSANVNNAISLIVEKWGQVDVLVNNACLAIFKLFEKKTIDETRREFEVNYFGYVNTIAAVLPYMKAKGKGIIHNLSSGVGITGFPGIYGYASTKGAIESLTRTLALEFEKYGICVNLMHPPLTNTKSASPLGIPVQAMDNPARVGRNLAKQVLSTKAVITPDFRTSVYLFFAYRYPLVLGRLFAKLTESSKNKEV